MKKLFALLSITMVFSIFSVAAQGVVGFKTNVLYGVVAQAPNLGVEVGLGRRTTIELAAGYNAWHMDGKYKNNKKLAHLLIEPEFKYYICERFNGHYIGVHGLYSFYNIGRHNLPMLFGSGSRDYRYQGHAYGGGISYGYQLMLSRRWNLEFSLGVGFARLNYEKYKCEKCGTRISSGHKNYIGPTKAAVSVVFVL